MGNGSPRLLRRRRTGHVIAIVLAFGCLAFAPDALAEGGLPGVSVGTTATLETDVAPTVTADVAIYMASCRFWYPKMFRPKPASLLSALLK